MPESQFAKKVKLKPNQRAAVINAPPGYLTQLAPLPVGVALSEHLDGRFDWLHVFVKTRAELEVILPAILRALEPESLLWISFPKGSSKMQTDLTRDQGWDALKSTDLKYTNLISVNDTWSAFSFRLYRPGEERKTWR